MSLVCAGPGTELVTSGVFVRVCHSLCVWALGVGGPLNSVPSFLQIPGIKVSGFRVWSSLTRTALLGCMPSSLRDAIWDPGKAVRRASGLPGTLRGSGGVPSTPNAPAIVILTTRGGGAIFTFINEPRGSGQVERPSLAGPTAGRCKSWDSKPHIPTGPTLPEALEYGFLARGHEPPSFHP